MSSKKQRGLRKKGLKKMTDKKPLGFFDSKSFNSEEIVASIKEHAKDLKENAKESNDD